MNYDTSHRVTAHLGSGQLGNVEKGVWYSPEGTLEVAIKTLKNQASEDERVKFLQEAAINGQFHHPNIVKLHGVVTVGEPVSLIYHTSIMNIIIVISMCMLCCIC